MDHIVDATVLVPLHKDLDVIENYNNGKDQDNWGATALWEMFKELEFIKLVDFRRNHESISTWLSNNLIEIPKLSNPIQLLSLKDIAQIPNQSTQYIIVEGAEQVTHIEEEIFVALTSLWAPFEDEEDYILSE